MSSGSKFARGTGRGQFRPPQNRGLVPLRHGTTSSKKTSLGQGRDVGGSVGAGNGSTTGNGREESFQLLAQPSTMGRPFAMIIRLQPEILEELKQAEADGIQASMKFGTNVTGHMIQVGSESFKFSSAPEPGDLCDIYEQKQGESGEAVLVEAAAAWRKLSVQRILSASEKDRVKKRTAEAENRQKQRKSILVDSSTQMIIPQAGAADANGRKPAPKLSKDPPPKKRRVTTSPIKQRPHNTTAVGIGNRQFASPASPAFDAPSTSVKGIQVNQMNDSYPSKGRAGSERVAGPSPSLLKEKPRTFAAGLPETVKSGSATNLTDLRNCLIGLLQENPKGVTIKAIDKALAEGLSGVADKRALEKVIKSVASFQAPGKYLLNPAAVEKGSYFEPGPPTSSARAEEAVRPMTHEAEPLNGISEKGALKDREDSSSFADRGLSTVVSPYAVKESTPKHRGDSNISNEDIPKQEAAHVAKDLSTGGSESSSSSGSGSGSDSESGSSGSGSGTASASGSGSGTDSDSGSSSSGASMDEDVDIMSDDDAEKGKLDAKQKPKVRESKPMTKDDIKTHESNKLEERRHTFVLDNPLATSDQANDPGQEVMAKPTDNILAAVFGSDEADDFGEDSGEPIRGEHSKQEKAAHVEYGERKAPTKAQISEDPRNRSSFEEPQGISSRDIEVLGIEEELDNLVEKISEPNMEVGTLGGSREGVFSSPQDHHKPLLKSGGRGPGKDNDKRRADSEHKNYSHLEKRERGTYPSNGGRPVLKYRPSLEVSNSLHESSPMDTEEHLQKMAKTSSERISQQVEAEARKTVSKKSTMRETYDRFDRAKVPEVVVKGKSPSNMARGEGASKLDDERVDRLSDRGGAETSDSVEIKRKKDKTLEEKMLDGANIGDISGRQSRDFETKHSQQKDAMAPSKGRVARESSYLSGAHDRDSSPHSHKSTKVTKHSRQKGETLDRAGLVVEQAERPLDDLDSNRRAKDVYGKGILKEAEAGGRLSSGEPFNLLAKDAARFGEFGESHGRSNVRENPRVVVPPADLRDPPYENGTLDSKKWRPPMEDSRSKATSGAANRLPYKWSLSPDQEDFQPLDRRLLDLSKQSPVRNFDEYRHHAHELRSAKRRPEESESLEMERSKRRAGAGQVKHKEEWFQGGSVKQNYTDKGRFSASNSQEFAGTTKLFPLENSVRSDEELEELYRQQRASQTHGASSDLRGDNLKAGDSLDTSKRQSPQSTDEVEGCEFFAPYEKKKPDLRGLINTRQEYKEYYKEYREKYPIYTKLNGVIEHNKKPFDLLSKDMERARCKNDEKKLAHACEKVRREYALRHKKQKRMFHAFKILHEELKAIKTRCKEYEEKVGQG